MAEPSVLLLDEPTAMMAPVVARQIYDSLAALKAEGITVVLVEQNVKKAVEVADYVYVLEMGRVRVHGDRLAIAGRMGDIIRGWITVDELAPGTGATRHGNGGPR
jgi:branched-chain amino acid transport system ATP-binding protein